MFFPLFGFFNFLHAEDFLSPTPTATTGSAVQSIQTTQTTTPIASNLSKYLAGNPPEPLFFPTPGPSDIHFKVVFAPVDPDEPDLYKIENDYQILINEVIPTLIKKGKIAELGKVQLSFFAKADKLKLPREELCRMRGGYYTWVVKAFYDLNRRKEAKFYLSLALFYDPRNPWALALKNELK
jgi:hypothetical protein